MHVSMNEEVSISFTFFSCFDFKYLNIYISIIDIIFLLYQFMYLSLGSSVWDFRSIYRISIVQWSGRWRSVPWVRVRLRLDFSPPTSIIFSAQPPKKLHCYSQQGYDFSFTCRILLIIFYRG